MTAAFITFFAAASVLAVTFLLARPLAFIAGIGGGLLAAFRLANALVARDWWLLLRDTLFTALCVVCYWAILILTQ